MTAGSTDQAVLPLVLSSAARTPFYLAVSLLAGTVIALQIAIMRAFAVGSWTHFGSLVVSLALLGFGLSSVVVFAGKDWFERHWRGAGGAALLLVGPLTVAANITAQAVPFNAIFLLSDPNQLWRLAANFLLYLLPFLAGAMFLGIAFLKNRGGFGRVYFADLFGSGVAGFVILIAMYALPPEQLIAVPLTLWTMSAVLWFGMSRSSFNSALAGALGIACVAAYLFLPGLTGIPSIATSQYKGVAYARNFPDGQRIYRSISPFGDLQIYSSSYMHFSPGLSDNAAFNLPDLPGNSFVAMYVDGEGPEGIMQEPPPEAQAYFHYLPMAFPYVLRSAARVFVVQFGGGISTMAALHLGATGVTVAESNPEVLRAFGDPVVRAASSDILRDPRVKVVDYDGRIYLMHTANRYDVIDLSLADSVGLSNPGGFAISEKYAYTREAMVDYIRALSDGGILSITAWNKEEPPKSILKLYSTLAEAATQYDPASAARSIFVASSYLSTTTLLYRKGGFTDDELDKLRKYTDAMSWDEIYSPGFAVDDSQSPAILAQYTQSIFGTGEAASPAAASTDVPEVPDLAIDGPDAATNTDTTDNTGEIAEPATTLGRLFWHWAMAGDIGKARDYVFDTRPLTNARPYFAAYEKVTDLPRTLDRLDLFQDDWGYLLLWATLGIAATAAAVLIVLPMVIGWRGVFSRSAGRAAIIVYFAALGLGYIMVEVGLISRSTVALANPTISASVLISGMLVFSGIGAYLSGRIVDRARVILPLIFVAVAVLLVVYALFLDPVLDLIGALPFPLRLLSCFVLVAPPALLMGYPMATAMAWLTRLGKDHMFVWAWGINGCFSVVGAAAVPIIATTFDLPAVLEVSAVAYLLAIPAFLMVLRPSRTADSNAIPQLG